MRGSEPVVVAHVRDLLFSSRIQETAQRLGYRFRAARSLDDLRAALTDPPRLLMLDLTASDLDQDAALRHGQLPVALDTDYLEEILNV